VSLVTAAALLAEIGEDRDHYPAVGVLLAEAGLAPVTRSSGRSHRVGFRSAVNTRVGFCSAVNTRLREACMSWAYNSLNTSPWARAAYDDARARKQSHHRALRGLGARWVRVLWRLDRRRPLRPGAAPQDRARPRSPRCQADRGHRRRLTHILTPAL
jgi:hypothetical protein